MEDGRWRKTDAVFAIRYPLSSILVLGLIQSILHVKVVPGASRDRVAGRYGEGIKVQTSAPPERGKANAAVAKILAQFLSVKVSQVELISAPANPRKQFRICGLSAAQLAEKLATLQ
jgi:uncharacterized protein (TIGR00251 family)